LFPNQNIKKENGNNRVSNYTKILYQMHMNNL